MASDSSSAMFNNASHIQIDNGTFNNVGRDQYNIQQNFPVVPGAMTDLSLAQRSSPAF